MPTRRPHDDARQVKALPYSLPSVNPPRDMPSTAIEATKKSTLQRRQCLRDRRSIQCASVARWRPTKYICATTIDAQQRGGACRFTLQVNSCADARLTSESSRGRVVYSRYLCIALAYMWRAVNLAKTSSLQRAQHESSITVRVLRRRATTRRDQAPSITDCHPVLTASHLKFLSEAQRRQRTL